MKDADSINEPSSKIHDFEKFFLFDIGLTNETEEKILEYILTSLEKSTKKYYIVTPNPEILVFAKKNKNFKTILNNAEIALIDGTGIIWASKLLGRKVKQRITGTDFMQRLCQEASKKPINVGFLGGGPEVAERTAECLQKKYPGLKIAFAAQEPDKLLKLLKEPKLLIDLLFVAFGFPKQEEWIAQNLDKIPVRIAIGVGGAFDYIGGNAPRAPVLIRKLGFEWLYRLIKQPWRWRRQLALIEFMYMVIKERLGKLVSVL